MLTKARGDASAAVAAVEERDGADPVVRLEGVWTTHTVAALDATMRRLAERRTGSLRLDLSGVSRMDTAGAWLVQRTIAGLEAAGTRVALGGGSESVATLLAAVAGAVRERSVPAPAPKRPLPTAAIETLGRVMVELGNDFILGMHILGATIRGGQLKLGRRGTLRPAAIVYQMERIGIGAIPVVALMAAIIGAIIAQQGAFQLRYFGAEIFVVDLVGILVLREIGVLLTAIMIAGRSGSSITAEIGSMKMREEIDALTVIGLNPIGVLVFPRLVALMIMLPCLTILANAAALGGAILVAWTYSDIVPAAFMERLHAGIATNTIMAGMIKAPFMALIIGVIASVEGMKTGGSAESLGRRVTASVVKAIFVVIIVDGLFAMFYAAIEF